MKILITLLIFCQTCFGITYLNTNTVGGDSGQLGGAKINANFFELWAHDVALSNLIAQCRVSLTNSDLATSNAIHSLMLNASNVLSTRMILYSNYLAAGYRASDVVMSNAFRTEINNLAITSSDYVNRLSLIGTNGHINLMHAFAEDNLRVPWGAFDVWYQSGSGWNWATLSNYMQIATNGGLYRCGVRSIYFTDGWQCDSRTNGHLAFDATHVPFGPTNSSRIAHDMGYQIGVYVQPGSATSAGFPPNNRTNIPIDVADYYNAGFDFIRVDWNNGNFSPSNVNYMVEEYRCWRREMDKYPKPMWLMVSMGGGEENTPGCLSITNADLMRQIFEIVNVVQVTQDAGVASTNLLNSLHVWTNVLSRFRATSKMLPYVRPGHVLRNDHPLLHLDQYALGPGGTYTINVGWQDVMLDAMMATRIEPQYSFTDDRAYILTNTAVVRIMLDPLVVPIRCIHSNEYSQVWARPLSGNQIAVIMWNTTTNVDDTNVFEFVNMGWPTNTVATVWDVKTNKVWSAPVTNGLTVVLPALCASNYIFTPVLNF